MKDAAGKSEQSETTEKIIKYETYRKWPQNPTFSDYFTFLPLNIVHYFSNLSNAFGWKFVTLVGSVYGIQQGMGFSWFSFSRVYYFKDVLDLGPSRAQTFVAATMTPWNIKPLFGMTSDILSMGGFRRTPYIIIAASIGAISQFFLSGVIPFSLVVVCLFMVGVNFSIACPDVMVDASIAIKVQQNKEFSSDLQSLCWGSYAFCSIFGYSTAGVLVYYIGAPATVGLLMIISCIVLTTSSLGFLGEQPIANSTPQPNKRFFALDFSVYHANQRLFMLAICVSLIAVILTVVTIATDDFIVQVLVVICCAATVACLCYFVNIKHSPDIAKFSVFIFLIESFTPNLETAMFYWYTDAEDGPQFSSFFMGFLSTLGYMLMLCGVGIFNKYLCYYPYRFTFMCTQGLLAVTGLLDVLIVSRVNTSIGIPDEAMCLLGDISLYSMVRRLKFMPILIIASRICPEGAEATLFALLMSLSNFGDAVAINIGAIIIRIFNVTEDNYDNFIYVVIVKSLLRLTLIPFIPLLAPEGSPQTREDYEESHKEGEEAGPEVINEMIQLSGRATKGDLEEDKPQPKDNNERKEGGDWVREKKKHDIIFAEEFVSPIAQSAVIT